MWFARLNGIWTKEIIFNKTGWVEIVKFDAGVMLENVPYSWASIDGIANWINLEK
jgi:hypothetical protein